MTSTSSSSGSEYCSGRGGDGVSKWQELMSDRVSLMGVVAGVGGAGGVVAVCEAVVSSKVMASVGGVVSKGDASYCCTRMILPGGFSAA